MVRTKIQHAVAHNFGISAESLYLTHPTFFSKLSSEDPATPHDEYWHPHIDKVNLVGPFTLKYGWIYNQW